MRKINILIAFTLLLCIIIPYNVNAEINNGHGGSGVSDTNQNFFLNECEFIPSKGYRVQNNNSHKNGASWNIITDEDMSELSTSNTYKIGNNYFRALKFKDVYFTDYGSTLQFQIYPHKLDWWGVNGIAWGTSVNYEGYLLLGTLNGKKIKFRDQNTSTSKVTNVGVLPDSYDNKVSPSDYAKYVNESYFYSQYDGVTYSLLHFKFSIRGNRAKNWIVVNIDSDDIGLVNDVYLFGFDLNPNIKSSDTDLSTLDKFGQTVDFDFIKSFVNDFNNGTEDTCYVGDLPSDIASPDDSIECDGVIDCTIKEITSSIEKWFDGLLSFLNDLFIPNTDTLTYMCTDFMEWFDNKLGFIGQPITFTIDFLNRFLTLKDTGHYIISVPNINVPLFNIPIIHAFDYDLASIRENEKLRRLHDTYLIIIKGTIGIAFLMLCYKTYDDVFGESDGINESLTDSQGYTVDDKTGEVTQNKHVVTRRTTYKNDKIPKEWRRK